MSQLALLKALPNIVFALWLSFLGYKAYAYFDDLAVQKKILRQTQGILNAQEQKMQEEHRQLEVLKSKLVSDLESLERDASELREKYGESSEKLDEFIRKHNLRIKSYQRANFSLRQKIESTKSNPKVTVVTKAGSCEENTEVFYRYEEERGRVILETPNCLKRGEEVLTLNQSFVVFGEVFQQEDGALEVSRLVLKEVDPNDPEIIVANAELKRGEFKYHPFKQPAKPNKPFNIVAGVGFDKDGFANVSLGISPLRYRQGYLSLSYQMFEQAKEIDRHAVSARVGWRPKLFEGDLNFGVSLGIGTPVTRLIPQYTLSFDFFVW